MRIARNDVVRHRSFLGVLPLACLTGRREDVLVHGAGLSNEPGPFQLRFRDKTHDFAHLCSKFVGILS
jgi:hypothetical protein